MPHKGFSWFQLKEHIRKYYFIYIIGFIACGMLSSMLYSSTAPRIPYEQEILLYLVDGYTSTEPLEKMEEQMLAYGQSIDETLQTVHFESILYNDPETDYNSNILLMARMALGDADVYLANSIGAEYICRAEAYLPLEDYLEAGWMEGLDLEPVYHTSEETGETRICSLSLDNVTALDEINAMFNDGAELIIAGNCSNIETTLEVTEYFIRELLEGNYAPAQSTEQTADNA